MNGLTVTQNVIQISASYWRLPPLNLLTSGRVIGAMALTGKAYSSKLALTNETLNALRGKYGNFESWWREQFGFGFDALTESEGRYLLRAEDADTIRNRLAEAKQTGGT